MSTTKMASTKVSQRPSSIVSAGSRNETSNGVTTAVKMSAVLVTPSHTLMNVEVGRKMYHGALRSASASRCTRASNVSATLFAAASAARVGGISRSGGTRAWRELAASASTDECSTQGQICFDFEV